MTDAPDPRQAYLNGIMANRGYAHRSHRLLATHDLPVLQALDRIPLASYVRARRLDGATKELVLIAAFTCVRAPGSIIAAHLTKVLKFGATAAQALDAIRLILPEAGYVACAPALAVWAECCNAKENPMPGASADPAVADAVAALAHAVQDTPRSLDGRVKGLIGVVALACLRAPPAMLQARLRQALADGATAQEILEALELIITPAGLPVFEAGLAAWADVTGAAELQPETAKAAP